MRLGSARKLCARVHLLRAWGEKHGVVISHDTPFVDPWRPTQKIVQSFPPSLHPPLHNHIPLSPMAVDKNLALKVSYFWNMPVDDHKLPD